MTDMTLYCGGTTEALRYAAAFLRDAGMHIVPEPTQQVERLLLDVPSFGAEGQLRGGGDIRKLLSQLPKSVVVYGGNLTHPALVGYRTVDFLQDADYLAENAAITAEGALDVALPCLSITLRRCPVLIIGWGRIGKCLGKLLQAMGSEVTIAARKESDRAVLRSLGYRAMDTACLAGDLHRHRLIFNTAPELVLNREQMELCHPDCVAIDLASKAGIAGEHVITARGLPGIHFPESSGKLIADTFLRKEC